MKILMSLPVKHTFKIHYQENQNKEKPLYQMPKFTPQIPWILHVRIKEKVSLKFSSLGFTQDKQKSNAYGTQALTYLSFFQKGKTKLNVRWWLAMHIKSRARITVPTQRRLSMLTADRVTVVRGSLSIHTLLRVLSTASQPQLRSCL